MPGLPVHHQLLELTQIHVHRVSDALQPLLSPSPPAFNLSQNQGLFKWVNYSHQVAKVLEFQLQHQSFQWPGVHPNPCPLSRWCHPTISSYVIPFSSCPQSFPASNIRTFISKVMSLLFKTLSRFVIAFLPRRKCLISWLQSPSAVILEPKKIKSIGVSIFSPFICHEVMGPDAMILSTCLFILYAD